jgi:hypothetical protein
MVIAGAACGGTPSGSPGLVPVATPVDASPSFARAAVFDPQNFSDPTNVDNRFFPLRPGTRFTWTGRAYDGDERISRQVVFTVSDLTKVIDGVRTVVTWDQDFTDGEREEIELSFFAQDDDGVVWQFGEYPEEWEEGEIVKTPAWIAGHDGALPGVIMQAAPTPGTPSYAEGWGPAVHWNDRGKVDAVGEHTCVPVDCYADVAVIDEFSPDEPGAHQLKYYAPEVGGVRVGWRGANEDEQEVLVLVELLHLDAEQMAEVRRTVLEQESRGYELSDVYARTVPIEQG